jgi:hypothetical protein
MAKLSISVPDELAARVREQVGRRGVSAFATEAMRNELVREGQRGRLAQLLGDLEDELGPPDETVIAEVDALWPDT